MEGLLRTLDFGDLGIILKVTRIENVYFGVGLCVRQISITHGWNLFIYGVEIHWQGLLRTLDFGDLDIIFKVTQIENVYLSISP